MIHPDTELRFINPKIGFGVIATRPIPRGTLTWVRDSLDQVLTEQQVEHLPPSLMKDFLKFSYYDSQGRYVLCWDTCRFMNHSCDPNVVLPGSDDFEIAVRDIEPGEQLSGDYATYNRDAGFRCFCESARCRHIIERADRHQLTERLDKLVQEAIGCIRQVPQPLWPLVTENDAIDQAVLDLRRIPSCRRQFFQRSY